MMNHGKGNGVSRLIHLKDEGDKKGQSERISPLIFNYVFLERLTFSFFGLLVLFGSH